MKNVVELRNYYYPWVLEQALENLTPADVYAGKGEEVLTRRDQIKEETLRKRRCQNFKEEARKVSLRKSFLLSHSV